MKKTRIKYLGLIIVLLSMVIVYQGIKLYESYVYPTYPIKFLPNSIIEQLDLQVDMSQEKIIEKIDQEVYESLDYIQYNDTIRFDNKDSYGNIEVSNKKENRYNIRVEIILLETGQTIYTSGLIQPGYYIEKVKLEKPLPTGEYVANIVFSFYETNEKYKLGDIARQVFLIVNE